MLQKLWSSYRSNGLRGTAAIALKRELKFGKAIEQQVSGKTGLEIGGPSRTFQTFIPIYRSIASLDNCVFSTTTVWEGTRADGSPNDFYNGRSGVNLVTDGTDLAKIGDHVYDFVLSCHNLEHIANPVKALKEWMRVTKPGGPLVILLPDYRRTFDRHRTPTPVAHMLDDWSNNVGEDDTTHLQEILAKHDLWKDPAAGNRQNFEARSHENFSNRCLHHHVFDEKNSKELLEAVGLTVVLVERALPNHIVLMARTPAT